jgi:hypothetical protein
MGARVPERRTVPTEGLSEYRETRATREQRRHTPRFLVGGLRGYYGSGGPPKKGDVNTERATVGADHGAVERDAPCCASERAALSAAS